MTKRKGCDFAAALLKLIAIGVTGSLFAQESGASGAIRLGLETQVYPTGIIAGLRLDYGLSDRSNLNFRIGYNDADREDNGEHDNEEGGGPGISLGWRTFYQDHHMGFFWGLRADVWFLDIDWQDSKDRQAAGSTEITVLQPTIEAGYRFGDADGWSIEPSLAFGFEINARTKGEDVGEGAILLAGVTLSYKFGSRR